ncbi:MAG: hypothetical protein HVN34_01125 [Methanobacteriaceae archaeon]|nr:hypothetical protein [Methanobacteriaceae archaeon]
MNWAADARELFILFQAPVILSVMGLITSLYIRFIMLQMVVQTWLNIDLTIVHILFNRVQMLM